MQLKVAIGVQASLIDLQDGNYNQVNKKIFCDFLEQPSFKDTFKSLPESIYRQVFKSL